MLFFVAMLAGPGADRALYASISPVSVPKAPSDPQTVYLSAGKFLVARGFMRDPNFSGTVIFLIRYDLLGALGVVVNRPTEILLSDALPNVDWLKESQSRLMWGGPVERTRLTILALSKEPIEGAKHLRGNLYVGWDIEQFRDLLEGRSGEIRAVRAYGGYAGWAPGQLAGEVERGGWRVVDAPEEVIFRDTSRLWYRLVGQR
jgi:putative transcriptional regulator